MPAHNFLVNEDGQLQPCAIARDWDLLQTPYRFYRFLTEVDEVVEQYPEETQALPLLHQLVRKLVLNSYWIQSQRPELDTKTGMGVTNLYDEIGFPLTVQTTIFAPGIKSTIHNHGTWGIIAILQGEEKNTFWQRLPNSTQIAPVQEYTLGTGDIISLTAQAIHCVEAVGEEPLITFNIYGETHHKTRFEFDPQTARAWNY